MALIDSLIAAWELDEASGDALDSHGSNDLTDNNSVGSGTGLVHAAARDLESGDSEYFSRSDNTDLSAGDIDFTLEMWLKPETLPNFAPPLTKDNNGGSREYGLYYSPGGPLQWYVFSGASGAGFTQVGASNFGVFTTGNWHHVIAWHDAGSNEVGISVNNGAPNTTSHSGGVYDGTAEFRIGRDGGGTYWDGLIGPVRLWKRLLTSDERAELYNGGAGLAYPFGVSIVPLVMHHRCMQKAS